MGFRPLDGGVGADSGASVGEARVEDAAFQVGDGGTMGSYLLLPRLQP